MKIVTVVGARPQFVKAAVVSRAIAAVNEQQGAISIDERIVHTGQHYDANMSQFFFEDLDIPKPAINLEIGSGTHGLQTGLMLQRLEEVIASEQPDWVLVYGDTNSTLSGALAAAKLHVPVAHVEAGLRSYNRKMPEEINRVVADHVADLLFAPTEDAVRNLRAEGIPVENIKKVGDVMYDAFLFYGARADQESQILDVIDMKEKKYILATIHRAENTDQSKRLSAIFDGLHKVCSDIPVVVPLHPRTKKALQKLGILEPLHEKLQMIDPVGYLDMIKLEKHATVIATDSGGIQKEAYFAGVPCVTLRDETEWVELVRLGWNKVVQPTDSRSIANALISACPGQVVEHGPYGNGKTSEAIIHGLLES